MNRKIEINNCSKGVLKILLSLFLVFFICGIGFAQNDNISGQDVDDNPNLHLGVKAGIGLSNIESTELTNKKIKPGMAVGLYVNYLFKKKFLLQVEFNGNLRGANFDFPKASSLQRISLFYFDVPIILHYSHSKKTKFLPFIGGQPSLIFRKDAYKTQEAVPQPDVLDIKTYDFALTFGLLIRMSPKIGFQIQANYGLININNHLAVSFYPYLGNGSAMYNRNLQLCLVF